MDRHWSNHLLSEFIALVLSYDDVMTAYQGGVEAISEALESEACALIDGATIVASIGFPATAVPTAQLLEIARTRPHTAEIDGLGTCVVDAAALEHDSTMVLVVARCDGIRFTRLEVSLIRGMSRTLSLAIRMLDTLTAERSLRETSDVLIRIARAIAQRAPLQEVLDTITQGAAGLLDADIALLQMCDPSDQLKMLLVSSQGLDGDPVERARQAAQFDAVIQQVVSRERVGEATDPGVETSVDGTVLAAPVYEDGVLIGSLAVAATRWRYDGADYELLLRFAEHASLALTDAHTVEQLSDAMYDPVTGLANRSLFLDRLQRAIARADMRETSIALLFCDVDNCKTINDSLGHTAGDGVLCCVAQRVVQAIRAEDVAARLGGDEFAVLLEDVSDPEEATAVAERLLVQFIDPVQFEGARVHVGVSVGVVLRHPGSEAPDELLRNADLAMYRSKAEGRQRLTVYEPWMHQRLIERLSLANDRRDALDDQFDVHYQPIVALDDGTVVAVEALARWQHPERGMVSPSVLIPLAEESGLIRRLGATVLHRACEDVQFWRRRFPGRRDLCVSVNVSALQLQDDGVVEQVREALVRSGLPAANVTIEITESALMQDPEGVTVRLGALKREGVGVAIDDFGTGYSSLSYLRQFPADVLKIDKVFVDDVRGGEGGALVEGIVGLGAPSGWARLPRASKPRRRRTGCSRWAAGWGRASPWDGRSRRRRRTPPGHR